MKAKYVIWGLSVIFFALIIFGLALKASKPNTPTSPHASAPVNATAPETVPPTPSTTQTPEPTPEPTLIDAFDIYSFLPQIPEDKWFKIGGEVDPTGYCWQVKELGEDDARDTLERQFNVPPSPLPLTPATYTHYTTRWTRIDFQNGYTAIAVSQTGEIKMVVAPDVFPAETLEKNFETSFMVYQIFEGRQAFSWGEQTEVAPWQRFQCGDGTKKRTS